MRKKITPEERAFRLGNMPILKLLFSMSVPVMFSMLIQALYNIVDSVFVGMVSVHYQESLSQALALQNLMVAFALGAGIGSASLLAKKLGEKKDDEASQLAKHGVWIGILISAFFLVFGYPITLGYMKLLIDNSHTDAFNGAMIYTTISLMTGFFPIFQLILSRILQACGNVIIPTIAQLIGAVINIALDPLFILVFHWGIAGAAISTVIGQIVAFSYIVICIKYKKICHIKIFELKLKVKSQYIKNIIKQGLPITLVSSIITITITYINFLFKKHAVYHGDTILGLYFKLQAFVFMPIYGLNQGALPIMSYNIGAQNKKRVLKTYSIALLSGIIISVISLIITQTCAEGLINLFISKDSVGFDESIIKMGENAFKIISWSYIPASLSIIANTLFQSIAKSYIAAISTFLRQIVVLCSVSTVALTTNWGINGVWSAFWIAELVSFVIFVPLSFYLIRKIFKKKELINKIKTEEETKLNDNEYDIIDDNNKLK